MRYLIGETEKMARDGCYDAFLWLKMIFYIRDQKLATFPESTNLPQFTDRNTVHMKKRIDKKE